MGSFPPLRYLVGVGVARRTRSSIAAFMQQLFSASDVVDQSRTVANQSQRHLMPFWFAKNMALFRSRKYEKSSMNLP